WGSNSDIFKNGNNHDYYKLWSNEQLNQFYDLTDLPPHTTQISGEMSIYFQGFTKYIKQVMKIKKSMMIESLPAQKINELQKNMLRNFEKAKILYFAMISNIENLNKLSDQYSAITEKENELIIKQQLTNLIIFGI